MISFLLVIAVTGALATVIGMRQVAGAVVREAQDRVTLDLNSASLTYLDALEDVQRVARFVAMREFGVRRALRERNRPVLLQALRTGMQEGGLDLLTVTDDRGRVVLRARNPDVAGDSQAEDPFVRRVLIERKPFASTQAVSRAELLKESADLAERARIELLPTPRAKPATETESTSGMMLKAAVPVVDDTGAFAGVLYGGILLNRNYDIVDRIKDTVYRGARYEGKDIGTATIFQKDLRISTNVMSLDGKRAIGTRVSSEVYDRVIGEGKTWAARAFVVNDWYLTAYEPITDIEGRVVGMLYVGMLEKKYTDMRANALLDFLGVTAAGIGFSVLVAYALAHALTRPIHRLKRGVEAIAQGDFDFHVSVETEDEIGALAQSFNRVRQELKETYERLQGRIESADEDLRNAYRELQEKQQQLIEAERLASMGQLSAGVAHELNNPLGTILIYSHMLLREPEDQGGKKDDLEMIVKEATRCKDIVRGLLDFARQSRVSKAPTDLGELVEEVIAIMTPRAEARGIRLTARLDAQLPRAMVDGKQIKQVLVNLVQNGIDASSAGGEVAIAATFQERGGTIEISVADTGCGIPRENLSKVFTPFFTTKTEGGGTGLGLAITYGVVKMHSGDITVRSEEGKGTTFTICLPMG